MEGDQIGWIVHDLTHGGTGVKRTSRNLQSFIETGAYTCTSVGIWLETIPGSSFGSRFACSIVADGSVR